MPRYSATDSETYDAASGPMVHTTREARYLSDVHPWWEDDDERAAVWEAVAESLAATYGRAIG